MPRPPICPPPKGAAEAFWKSKGKGWGKGSKFGVRKAKQDVKAKTMTWIGQFQMMEIGEQSSAEGIRGMK